VAVTEELSLADQVVLAVVGEGRTHGWAIVKLLAPDGDLGRIWTLSRPLTYRAIDHVVELGLVERAEAGRRAELRITRRGRRARARWLETPVEHLRDLRTEFLLKLVLRQRVGLDVADLVERQRRRLAPAIDALTGAEPTDLVDRWRQESARAAQRFLDGA
jgi:PadR family transcriptional regulator AphA